MEYICGSHSNPISIFKQVILLAMLINVTLSYPAYTNFAGEPIYQSQPYDNKIIFSASEAPTSFPSTQSPLANPNQSQEYQAFINELYRFDRDKKPQQINNQPNQNLNQNNGYNPFASSSNNYPIYVNVPVPVIPADYVQGEQTHKIRKRAITFRPLFVYKQQSIKKQRIKAEQQQQQQPQQPQQQQHYHSPTYVPANKSPTYTDSNNIIRQEYNPYYAPYQYGQRYPYSY